MATFLRTEYVGGEIAYINLDHVTRIHPRGISERDGEKFVYAHFTLNERGPWGEQDGVPLTARKTDFDRLVKRAGEDTP